VATNLPILGASPQATPTVQSMTVTPTHDVDTTLQQIAALQAAGATSSAWPARAGGRRRARRDRRSRPVPVIADIHFQWKYAVAAIEAGGAPGADQPGQHQEARQGQADRRRSPRSRHRPSASASTAARSSSDPRQVRRPTPEAMVESALRRGPPARGRRLLQHQDLGQALRPVGDDPDLPAARRVLRLPAAPRRHRGRAEDTGSVKSAVGIGTLLAEGIGDTIRVSLSADPVEEVKAGIGILESLHLRERGLDVVSCPSCGRAQVDVYTLAENVQKGLEGKIDVPCASPSWAASSTARARRARPTSAWPPATARARSSGRARRRDRAEEDIVETLVHFANEMADEIRAERGTGRPKSSPDSVAAGSCG
jgi:(E)-4-hydroxy-3-methylbut-2-enyl-diphosphate synthase